MEKEGKHMGKEGIHMEKEGIHTERVENVKKSCGNTNGSYYTGDE